MRTVYGPATSTSPMSQGHGPRASKSGPLRCLPPALPLAHAALPRRPGPLRDLSRARPRGALRRRSGARACGAGVPPLPRMRHARPRFCPRPTGTELRIRSALRLGGANETSCVARRGVTSCLWAEDPPTAPDLLPTGSDCGAIPAVSQQLSARNPRLTSAITPGDTSQVVIGFPILRTQGSPRCRSGPCRGAQGV